MPNMSFDTDAHVLPCAVRTQFVCAGQLRRWAAVKALTAVMLILGAPPVRADAFYTLVGYVCDKVGDRLVVTYHGGYNEAGESMMAHKLETQWNPWELVVAKDDDHIGSVLTIKRRCHLSDGVYQVALWAVPGNFNVQGRCGAAMTAGAEVKRGAKIVSRVAGFESDCGDLESSVITRVEICPKRPEAVKVSVPHDEFYK